MKYCRSLKFEEAPDYYVLKKLITTYFSKSKFDVDFVFDWRKPNDKQIKEPQRSISSMMIPNIKVEIQKEEFLPEIVLKTKASCNMLNDVMNELKEERKNLLEVPIKIKAQCSFNNDSNKAEEDPGEDNDKCNFDNNDISEVCIVRITIDDWIPNENPVHKIGRAHV